MMNHHLLKKFDIPENMALEEVKRLLVKEEKRIIKDFFGEIKITLAWEGSLSEMQEQITPWSSEDITLYYHCRPESAEIKYVLAERRVEIIAGNLVTFYDDYQLLRTNKNQLQELEQFSDFLEELSSIDELLVEKNQETPMVKGTYYLAVLFRVLDILRLELSHHQSQSRLLNIELIKRIDAINGLLARYILNILIDKKVDENKELLQKMFKAIGSQDQEVLPWLIVFFKRELLLYVDDEDRNKLIEEFLKLSAIKHPSSIDQQWLEIGGQTVKPALDKTLSEFFKAEGNLWHYLASQPLEQKLQKIELYLLNKRLSDWVMQNICMDLVTEAKKYPQHHELFRVLYLCCERIYQEQDYLEQTHDYLKIVNRDIETKNFLMPAISIATLSDVNIAAKKACELSVIPPSAVIFYEMVENASAMLIQILTKYYDKPSLIKLLSTIFMDENYLDQHFMFFDGLAAKIDLKENDFPLIALQKHYADPHSKRDPIQLWEAVLDSKIIMQSRFLASPKNEKLFENLQQIGKQLVNRDKILQYPKRYIELSLALAVYCTFYTEPVSRLLYSSPQLIRKESVAWASKFFMQITSLLPQNAGQKFELRKALSLLDIMMDPPNQTYIDEKNLVQKCVVSLLDAHTPQPGNNSTYTLELLRGFLSRHVNEGNLTSLTQTHIDQLDLFPVCHLPPQLFQIMGAGRKISSAAIPEFFSYTKKVRILKVIAAQDIMESCLSPLQMLAETLLESVSQKEIKENTKKNKLRKELFAYTQLYLEYCQQELIQNKQLSDAEQKAYDNYIQYWTNPMVAQICKTAGKITKYLEKETEGVFLSDFLDEKTKKQFEDWETLKETMRRCFLSLTNASQVKLLIISVNRLIDFHSGRYANLLTTLRDDLCSLEVYAKKQRPETISKFNEEKCFHAINIIKRQCELYQKHLNTISQEKPNMHNARRIQKAKDKLLDLQNIIKFDETKLPSAQLIEFNIKFEEFNKKHAKPDSDIENEKANKRFWRRIAYALLTCGVYAIVRGKQLGVFQFYKSHKDVLRNTVEKIKQGTSISL